MNMNFVSPKVTAGTKDKYEIDITYKGPVHVIA